MFRSLPGALISVWGTSTTDVWATGADPGDGLGPMVLHFDGAGWTRLDTGTRGDLWWVFGFAGGPVFFGGQGGRILRYSAGLFETMPTPATPGTSIVFGIWGSAPDDVWAVGGTGTSGAFAWRFDGVSWADAPGLPASLGSSASLFKVWGTAANDVWLVGTGGTIVHHDGLSATVAPPVTTRTLFTVHAASTARSAAVGGGAAGVILENDGAGWVDVSPAGTALLFGVSLSATNADDGYAVGLGGAVVRRSASGWAPEPTGLDVYETLHAVWIDPGGGVWAAGGQVFAPPLVQGVLIHRGAPVPGGTYP